MGPYGGVGLEFRGIPVLSNEDTRCPRVILEARIDTSPLLQQVSSLHSNAFVFLAQVGISAFMSSPLCTLFIFFGRQASYFSLAPRV